MEKSKTRIYRKWFFGLLVLFFTMEGVFAQSYYDIVRNLKFHQKDEYVFSLTNTEFYLDLENILPNDVTVYMNSIPENVELISIKKETYIPPVESSNSTYGTHIIITVRFLKSGDFKLFASDLQIKTGFYKIPFELVHVYDNVQVLKPKISVNFINDEYNNKSFGPINITEGTHVQYIVNVQFASDIKNISWDLPENSLFEEIEEYEVKKISDQNLEQVSKIYPLAKFDWCPLKEGKQKLPVVNVTATAFNGSVINIPFPSYILNVTKNVHPSVSANTEANSEFAYAFLPPVDMPENEGLEISDEDLKHYVVLLGKELNSFPMISDSSVKRSEFEKECGFSEIKSFPRKPLFYLSIVFAIFSFVVGICLLISKNYSAFILCIPVICMFSAISIFSGIKVSRQYAVVLDGKLMTIPEKDSSNGVELKKGSVVRIYKETGSWVYVEYSDAYGWVSKDNVIFVK